MSRRGTVRIICARCRRSRMHECRMLCASCYTIIRRSDIESLDDYPKVSRDSEVLVSEAEFLARQHPGWTRRQLAARLGTTYANLWAAESRARKRAAA